MDYLAIIVNLICVYAVLAASLNLIMGYGGLFSVAHAAFFGIGAYAFALTTIHLGVPFAVALILAFIAAALASAVISVPSLRVSGDYLMLATFAIQILATSLFLNLPITGGPAGIRNIPSAQFFGLAPHSRIGTLIGFIVVATLCWYVMAEMARSPFGRVLKAIREDELATASIGKNVMWFKISAFAAGCGFAGVAGGMLAAGAIRDLLGGGSAHAQSNPNPNAPAAGGADTTSAEQARQDWEQDVVQDAADDDPSWGDDGGDLDI
jgi:branched-chain amino acid transport system permease protein